jgi:hypothetical protein
VAAGFGDSYRKCCATRISYRAHTLPGLSESAGGRSQHVLAYVLESSNVGRMLLGAVASDGFGFGVGAGADT